MYTPVLKWKAGEKRALKNLPDIIKSNILPIIELQPCIDAEESTEIIKKFGDDIIKYLGKNSEFLLDFSYFDIELQLENYVKAFLEVSLSKGVKCIPIISLNNYDLYTEQFVEAHNFIKNGIAIRITKENLINNLNNSQNINNVKKILEETQKDESSSILIIDFESISENNLSYNVLVYNHIKSNLNLESYKKVILVGTGFPNGFPSSYMDGENQKEFPRLEQKLWKNLDINSNEKIIYGDYCCSSPAPLIADSRNLRPSAIIKYTTENSWFIVRGEQLFRAGHSQYHDLSKKIINSKYFKGKTYSYGDEFIFNCASDDDSKTGNPTTWVQVATNHHITLAVNQISKSL